GSAPLQPASPARRRAPARGRRQRRQGSTSVPSRGEGGVPLRRKSPTNPPVPPNESLVDESRAAADLGHQAFQKLDDPQMNEVVPGGKDHQRQHQRQTEPKAIFLRALAKRLPPNGLSGIKQEMPPVQNGNRKEVDEAEIDRQHRNEPEHGDYSSLRH